MTSSIYSIFASKLTSVLFDIFLPGKCQVMYRTNWCHDFVRFSFWLKTSNTTVLTTQHTTTNIDKSHLCHGDVSFWNVRKTHHNPSAKNEWSFVKILLANLRVPGLCSCKPLLWQTMIHDTFHFIHHELAWHMHTGKNFGQPENAFPVQLFCQTCTSMTNSTPWQRANAINSVCVKCLKTNKRARSGEIT